jgi:hypothetical protein
LLTYQAIKPSTHSNPVSAVFPLHVTMITTQHRCAYLPDEYLL